MPIDKNNLVGIDAEWAHGYKCRMVCLYGKIDGKPYRKTLYPGDEPVHIPNLVYFAMPMDLYVARELVSYDTAIDASLLCNLVDNMSRFRGNKFGRRLQDRSFRHLNYKMLHTMSAKTHNEQALRELTLEETRALATHCREDAKVAYRLATEVPFNEPEMFTEWNRLSVRWNDIMKNGIHLNPAFVEFWKEPVEMSKRIVKRCQAKGIRCDAFSVDEETGHIKLNERKMKEWFIRTEEYFGWLSGFTEREWLDYSSYERHKSDFYLLSGSANPKVAVPAKAVYLALQARLLQQKRVPMTDTIYQMETPFGQQSGRANPTSHLIQAGTIFRASIMPPKGKAYVSLDIKSQEAIVAAHLSHCQELMDATKKDIYSYFYCVITNQPYKKFPKLSPERAFAKVIVLAWLYGGGRKTFKLKMETIGKANNRMATDVENQLARAFRSYMDWQFFTVVDAVYEGVIRTEIDKVSLRVDYDSNEKQVINMKCQGTAADMLRHIVDRMLEEGYVVVASLFDGLYLEVDLDGAEEHAEEARAAMERICNEVYPVYQPWQVEAVSDAYWHEFHPTPEGSTDAEKDAWRNQRHYFTHGLFEKDYIQELRELGILGLVPRWDDVPAEMYDA